MLSPRSDKRAICFFFFSSHKNLRYEKMQKAPSQPTEDKESENLAGLFLSLVVGGLLALVVVVILIGLVIVRLTR